MDSILDPITVPPVLAAHPWPTNGHLIEDVARIGYLDEDWLTLDPTYGHGVFWSRWRPGFGNLIVSDLDPDKNPTGNSVDFRDLPYPDSRFDAVVFDPPYKLNGTPDEKTDKRYGVHVPTTWQERMALILDGATECARVTRDVLLVKVQDQVCSGKIRWQTLEVTDRLESGGGMELVDRFDMLGAGRTQPAGRQQRHAYGRPSTLLVFRK